MESRIFYLLASASSNHESSNMFTMFFLNINLASAQNDLRSSVHRSTYLTSVLCLTQTFHSQSHQRVDHIHRQKFQSQKKE